MHESGWELPAQGRGGLSGLQVARRPLLLVRGRILPPLFGGDSLLPRAGKDRGCSLRAQRLQSGADLSLSIALAGGSGQGGGTQDLQGGVGPPCAFMGGLARG